MLDTVATPEGAFTADVAGPLGAPLVLLLHGFPQSRHSWRHQVPALGAAGYRAVAPDQRGYSPGVRPDPSNLEAYGIDRLVADVLDLAEAEGKGAARFHLVGHDWGGQVAWAVRAIDCEPTIKPTLRFSTPSGPRPDNSRLSAFQTGSSRSAPMAER